MTETATQISDVGFAVSIAGFIYFAMAAIAGVHVVLNKKNEASAVSWLGVIILSPFFGALLYWLFGVNRIRRRTQSMINESIDASSNQRAENEVDVAAGTDVLHERMRVGGLIHKAPYLPGNSVTLLQNGDEAYPSMLAAINAADQSVVLSSYIFDYDEIGKQFVDAMVAAKERGVEVRVLIDGFGIDYAIGLAKPDRMLKKQGVKTARFLSTLFTTDTRFINLRNHRKILAVDGQVAFIGGMNIREENLLDSTSKHKTQDLHFEVRGPVIDQINKVFEQDWQFASRELLSLPEWSGPADQGTTCRIIVDGPDDNFHKLGLTLLEAINTAQTSIRIITPYFLPDEKILSGLQLAVLRDVDVELIVPSKNNLRVVGWAMAANHQKLLDIGVHLYQSALPFDHSKLMIVDDNWTLLGSSNWDARSLELNFEINMECYCEMFTSKCLAVFEGKRTISHRMRAVTSKSFLVNMRNNFFRLFTPYL